MVLTRLLHTLDPETAHRIAIRALALAPLPAAPAAPAALAVELAGLRLAHPIGLAAGFDKNAEAYAGLARLGFAFVEIGTVTPRPQAGNPRPRLFRLREDWALVNRLGFNSDGLAVVAARLAARDQARGVVGANIGMNRDTAEPLADYLAGLERLYPLADYLTVNISSPNTPGLRVLQKADRLAALLAPLVARRDALAAMSRRRPLFVKIAPDLEPDDEVAIAEIALATGIDGLIVSNTTIARLPTLRSPARTESGGLSGAPLFAPSTRLLARLALRLEGRLPLIGVGGVSSAADAYAKLRAGATAVQLYTSFVYEGPGLVRHLVRALAEHLAADGLTSIAAAIGRDVERWAAA